MRKILPLLLTVLCTSLGMNAIASHIAGAKITYVQVDATNYVVTVSILRDCNGIGAPATAPLDVSGSCGNFTQILPQTSAIFTSSSCDVVSFPSTCFGGTYPGFELVNYSDTVPLPGGPTCSWTLSWDLCCRNNSVVNLSNPAGESTYVECVLNQPSAGQNSSPEYLETTIPVFCVNVPATYNPVVIDAEGDSLLYELVDALDGAGAPVAYAAGFTGASPITGIAIDAATGILNFTPNLSGSFVVVIQVSEYRNGEFLGYTQYDKQFIVDANCANNVPQPVSASMSNLTGTASQTGPLSLLMCEGQDFCFDLSFFDIDPGQFVNVSSDLSSLAGATLNLSGTDTITGTLCWTAPVGSSGTYPILVTAGDGQCPLEGLVSLGVLITVTSGTNAGPDLTICNGTPGGLGFTGFAPYQWSVISGDPINVGTNFSCDTCLTSFASPTSTTTYVLNSPAAPVGCVASDTVTVNVLGTVALNVSLDSAYVCFGEDVNLSSSVSPPSSAFSVSWEPAGSFSNPQTAITIYQPPGVVSDWIYVNHNNGVGCSLLDSVYVESTLTPQFDLGVDSIWVGAGPIALSGTPAGGTFLGNGVFNGNFVPGAAGVGTWVIGYQGTGGCIETAFDTIVVTQEVGINEIDPLSDMLIMPNPASNQFSLANVSGLVSLELYNTQGKMVRQWAEHRGSFNVNDLDPGLYHAVVYANDKIMRAGLVIE